MTRKQFDFPGPPAIYKRCWKQVNWPWVYTELQKWRKVLEGFMHIPGVDKHVEKLTALINYILDMKWPVKKISTKKNYSPYVTEALKKSGHISNLITSWGKKLTELTNSTMKSE